MSKNSDLIIKKMDKVSENIREAEKHLKSFAFVPFKSGQLEWNKDGYGSWRLQCEGKPLLECSFETRIQTIQDLAQLIDLAETQCLAALSDIEVD